ncbi:LysR family transcriptional regulator [Corynebacterium poyangense]|uniref:LysR family transcriptional regulator n=1 Tax=Corynebacterium poyangense TaxID=2684405 RepID=A0A7H0SN23_9CORY|nr:LysR family transcriptional regulator substrate-binding protein [Corynebacterium poyangense]QNQ89948.1 LysR family transcriptional regulator [Corynebacterium poyangense]
MLSLAFVTGTQPDKWVRRYRDRTSHGPLSYHSDDDPLVLLTQRKVDAVLCRLPDSRINQDECFVVELYEEQPGVAVPKDSVFGEAAVAVTDHDIADEICHYQPVSGQPVDIGAIRTGLQIVAANVGVVLGPRPVLQLLSGKKIVDLEFCAPSWPATRVALVWWKDRDAPDIQDLVGIMKGRRPSSSRQEGASGRKPKKSAREKTLDKQRRRQRREGYRTSSMQKGKGRKGKRGRR